MFVLIGGRGVILAATFGATTMSGIRMYGLLVQGS